MEHGTICIAAPASALGAPATDSQGGPDSGQGTNSAVALPPPSADDVERWCHTFAGPAEHAELLRHMRQARPQVVERLAQAAAAMPEAGTTFQGFRLLEELG